DTDAKQNLLFIDAGLIVFLRTSLHRERAAQGIVNVAEHDNETVAFSLEQDAVILFDERHQQAMRLVDSLQEMNDAEFGNVPGKACEIGIKHRPLLAEKS